MVVRVLTLLVDTTAAVPQDSRDMTVKKVLCLFGNPVYGSHI